MSEDRLARIEASVARIEANQAEMRAAVIGNEELGQEGLIKRSKDHERRIKFLEKIAVMGAGAGFVISVVYGFFRDFFIPKHTS